MGKSSAILIFVLLVGSAIGALWMRSDNSVREDYLGKQFERLDQEQASVTERKELSDAEFRDYSAAVHEQSRIARNMQERLHEQELALTGAENRWIYLVIVAVVVTVIAVVWISRSTDERARITIQNALGLPPAQMHDYLVKSQTAAASAPELTMGRVGAKQPPPKLLEAGQGGKKGFHPPIRRRRNNRRKRH